MPISIPPFTDVPAPGDPLASPWAQHITQFAVDQISSGPTAPTNPEAELWYDTSDLGASLPNTARGFVAYAQAPAIQVISSSTLVDLAGVTVTFTADPTRRYLTTLGCGRLDQSVASGLAEMVVTDAAGSLTLAWVFLQIATGTIGSMSAQRYETGLSGSVTRKARAKVSAGQFSTQSHLSWLPFLLVQDIGGV